MLSKKHSVNSAQSSNNCQLTNENVRCLTRRQLFHQTGNAVLTGAVLSSLSDMPLLSGQNSLLYADEPSGAASSIAKPISDETRTSLGQKGTVLERSVLSSICPDGYFGWPTIALKPDGELLAVTSGGREGHICPFGQVQLFRSKDGGKSWTWPQTLYDGPIDDRDAGIFVTQKGTILVSTFTSIAYESVFRPQYEKFLQGKTIDWDAARFERWRGVHERLSEEERKKELGCWMLRSTDDGRTWSARYSSIYNSPHGPFQLKNGRLLYAGKKLWGNNENGVVYSDDDGQTWNKLSLIPTRKNDNPASEYHELHGVEAENGRIIVQIRKDSGANAGETLQTESEDGGKTWTVPHTINVWGLPSHLLKLHDGRLLMTYGHRRNPFGNQARISENNGETWSEPIFISNDGTSGDLGYPSTVQLADDSLITVWYELMKSSPKAVLRFARWTL